jgi:hypothetical protein
MGATRWPMCCVPSSGEQQCARTDKLRCTEMTSTAGSVRQAQGRHQRMQCAIRSMPQATCRKQEINRSFSASRNGKANGDDSQDSVTGDGRQFFATPSPKESMKAARFVLPLRCAYASGRGSGSPRSFLGLSPTDGRAPRSGLSAAAIAARQRAM